MTEPSTIGPSDNTTPDPPPTPDGYDGPYLFDYSTIVLLLLSLPMFVLSSVGFGWVLWQIHGQYVFSSVFTITEIDGGNSIRVGRDRSWDSVSRGADHGCRRSRTDSRSGDAVLWVRGHSSLAKSETA